MKRRESWESESTPPKKDDAWWQSLLIEDAKSHPSRAKRPKSGKGKSSSSPEMDWVDWTRVLEIQEKEALCYAEVTGFNRGGLLVRAQEFQGFVPRSHLKALDAAGNKLDSNLESYMGEELQLKVIECDPERGRIVLSERAALTEPGSRQRLLEALNEGKLLQGQVTNVTPFGLFIDLGGIEGLVHISELSWGRVAHPREIAKIGDELSVIVLELDEGRDRISLSIKQGIPNPWNEAASRYPEGTELQVEITEVVHFGAFARLEEGLEGLIHISQMRLHERLDPRLVLERGMNLKVQVIQVEAERQRLSLQLLEEPWNDENSSGPAWMDDQP